MIGTRDKKLLKEFGENLKKVRKSQKISLRKLALEAEVDYTGLSKIEMGKTAPNLLTLYALAEALKIHPRELLP